MADTHAWQGLIMGLINSLNIATSGLRTTQAGINVVASNIAQADVDGYKRQELSTEQMQVSSGVRPEVKRAGDSYLESQYRLETAKSAQADVNDYYLSRVDQLFGAPGGAGSLDTLLNDFASSLDALASSPDDFTTRQQVLGSAQSLAGSLNNVSDQIQALRQNAEDNIASVVGDVNDALQRLEGINHSLSNSKPGATGYNELLDERDRQLARLSDAMDIRVLERDNGAVAVFTSSGDNLLDVDAVRLEFDQRGNIDANSLYSPDAAERGVGTVSLQGAGTYSLDLIRNGVLGNGRLSALIEMRDSVLAGAQAQLDELAGSLSKSLSDVKVDGTAATSGAASGFDIDLSGLQPGNSVSLSYVENGQTKNVTIIRVDDASKLPLADSATPTAGDKVIGVDFSGGYAAAATAINSELSPGVVVSANAGGLRFLDDGAGNTSDITALSSTRTVTGVQDGTNALPLFMDGQVAQVAYTGSLDGVAQKTGLASRIGVNQQVLNDNELLVRKSATTNIGDTSRPRELIDRLGASKTTFSPDTGIGSAKAPYTGTVLDFARIVVADQTGKAESAATAKASQEVVKSAIEQQLSSKTGVDIDTELTKLIALQNSFAANARIVKAAQEMLDRLMQI